VDSNSRTKARRMFRLATCGLLVREVVYALKSSNYLPQRNLTGVLISFSTAENARHPIRSYRSISNAMNFDHSEPPAAGPVADLFDYQSFQLLRGFSRLPHLFSLARERAGTNDFKALAKDFEKSYPTFLRAKLVRAPTLSDATNFPTALSATSHVRLQIGKWTPRHPKAQQRRRDFVECDATVRLIAERAAAPAARDPVLVVACKDRSVDYGTALKVSES
jgi:hypothetical protein